MTGETGNGPPDALSVSLWQGRFPSAERPRVVLQQGVAELVCEVAVRDAYPPRAASCAAVRSAFAIASIWATVMFA